MTQLGAQFAGQAYAASNELLNFAQTIFSPSSRMLVTPPGALRTGQTLYVVLHAFNTSVLPRQLWVMPWWLHPTFEYRYPGQNGYTASDLANFGPQNPQIYWQDSLWVTSPKRLDLVGPPSPPGTCISDMQSDVWAIDIPASTTVKKAFFYPSHGFGLAITSQLYDSGEPMDGSVGWTTRVIPGATHAVFQEGQG